MKTLRPAAVAASATCSGTLPPAARITSGSPLRMSRELPAASAVIAVALVILVAGALLAVARRPWPCQRMCAGLADEFDERVDGGVAAEIADEILQPLFTRAVRQEEETIRLPDLVDRRPAEAAAAETDDIDA